MKKTFVSALSLSSILFAGCSTVAHKPLTSPLQAGTTTLAHPVLESERVCSVLQDKRCVVEHELSVNLDDSLRKVVVLSEHEGIRKLVEFSSSSIYEECWAFVPLKSLWVEVGFNSRTNKTESGFEERFVEHDNGIIRSLADIYGEVTIYHFHPDIPHGVSQDSISFTYITASPPGVKDIYSLLNTYVNVEIPGDGIVNEGVASKYGLFYFQPKRDLSEEDIVEAVMLWGDLGLMVSSSYDQYYDGWLEKLKKDYTSASFKAETKQRTKTLLGDRKLASREEAFQLVADAFALTALDKFGTYEDDYIKVWFEPLCD
ncbi:hypothetical protein GOV10_05135 [Candidatus Woesearchaeota archaeon]|nr:hypothetical protein [Candidatus Woesearchaeota archaeon]